MSDANSALRLAVLDNDIDKINEAVANGADINSRSEEKLPLWKYRGSGTGNSVLHIALWQQLTPRPIIDRLLELGADVNLKSTGNHCTPLHCAARGNNVDIIAILLDRGCDPNAKDKDETTPLSWGACHDSKEAIELLIERGADIHDRSKIGETAFLFSCWSGHCRVAEALLARGANVHDEDNYGNSSLSYAAQFGKVEIVKMLISIGANMHKPNKSFRSAFYLAYMFNEFEIVSILRNWPVTMVIVVMQELFVYNQVDVTSFCDLFEFIG